MLDRNSSVRDGFHRRAMCGALTLMVILATSSFQQLGAQGVDEPPVIEHVPSVEPASGPMQRFEASVVDDKEGVVVYLYYKLPGDQEFETVQMNPLPAQNLFDAFVDLGDTNSETTIEYFFAATDSSENTTYSGYPDTYKRLASGAALITTTDAALSDAPEAPTGDVSQVAGSEPVAATTAQPKKSNTVRNILIGVAVAVLFVGLIKPTDDDDPVPGNTITINIPTP